MPKLQTKAGDCYQRVYSAVALKTDEQFETAKNAIIDMLLSLPQLQADMQLEPVIVHGFPTLQDHGPCHGRPYGHAWCEIWSFVLHWFEGEWLVTHRILFYHAGQIDPTYCRTFSAQEALRESIEQKTYGYWNDRVPDNVVFWDDVEDLYRQAAQETKDASET